MGVNDTGIKDLSEIIYLEDNIFEENYSTWKNWTPVETNRIENFFSTNSVRISLILAYTFVFGSCFLGNLLVILIVAFHKRMRTVTNFFLVNLAVADLCVGLFCVYQNLYNYLTTSWSLGNFLCKMYHFVQSLSYTTSIGILTVICIERYIAIVLPMWKKRIITLRRLRFVIIIVWLVSAVYCSPRLFMFGTSVVPLKGEYFVICHMKRALYNSKTYDIVNFVVCFLLPLIIISVMYSIICVRLWKNQMPKQPDEMRLRTFSKAIQNNSTVSSVMERKEDADSLKAENSTIVLHKELPRSRNWRKRTRTLILRRNSQQNANTPVIKARRKVIRLLVAVVFTFMLCNLPFHARKFWQYWSPNYQGGSSSSAIFTIVTNLILYLNSGINPILYAFLSRKFRHSIMDLVHCRVEKRLTFRRITQRFQYDFSGHNNTAV
ncbi:trissin receptor-like [Limulus polyphemus]|uniref:Trissin receptor-like n=1 Tax=Limulus polyphemus TaxID=6850 RepID=A0ABM1SIR0_LIMPO|nr:trissin receptor-like [Limulus polyphemus]